MVSVTSRVPRAASLTLRAISWVATCCSSTAAATPRAMLCTLPMVRADLVDRRPRSRGWRPGSCAICARDLVGGLGGLGRRGPSPRWRPRRSRGPASPARAASMVALSASRLVWPAMLEISATTSPMRAAPSARASTRALVRRLLSTAPAAAAEVWPTCWPISLAVAASSSVAAATAWTFCAVSLAAAHHGGRLPVGALGIGRHRAGGLLHRGGGAREVAHEAADAALEAVGEVRPLGAAAARWRGRRPRPGSPAGPRASRIERGEDLPCSPRSRRSRRGPA